MHQLEHKKSAGIKRSIILSSAIRVFVFNHFRAPDALAKSATCVEQSETYAELI
jgi:hypothetical protein